MACPYFRGVLDSTIFSPFCPIPILVLGVAPIKPPFDHLTIEECWDVRPSLCVGRFLVSPQVFDHLLLIFCGS